MKSLVIKLPKKLSREAAARLGSERVAPGQAVPLSQGALTLAERDRSAGLVATVTVPRNAPSGEQYGVIWAQESSSGTGNVTLVSRVGIRVYLSIGAGGAAAPNFTLGTPAASRTAAGTPVVRVAVNNTGGTAVDVRGTLQLTSGPGGVSAGPFTAQTIDTIAPGQSSPDTFVLSSKLPTGPWQASFTMVSGLIIAALIVLAAILLLIIRSRRSRRSRRSGGSRGSRRTPQATGA